MASKKIRVHELAKELNIDNNKIILQFLENKGITGKTASSGLEEEYVVLIKNNFSSNSAPKEKLVNENKSNSNTLPKNASNQELNKINNLDTRIKNSDTIISNDISEGNNLNANNNETKYPPKENKTSISSSIKERMAQKAQSLKDKFSSRTGLKAKLEIKNKESELTNEPVKPIEQKTTPTYSNSNNQSADGQQRNNNFRDRNNSNYQPNSNNQSADGQQRNNNFRDRNNSNYQPNSNNQSADGQQRNNNFRDRNNSNYQPNSNNQSADGQQRNNNFRDRNNSNYQPNSNNQSADGQQRNNNFRDRNNSNYQPNSNNQSADGQQRNNNFRDRNNSNYQPNSNNQSADGQQRNNNFRDRNNSNYQPNSNNQSADGQQRNNNFRDRNNSNYQPNTSNTSSGAGTSERKDGFKAPVKLFSLNDKGRFNSNSSDGQKGRTSSGQPFGDKKPFSPLPEQRKNEGIVIDPSKKKDKNKKDRDSSGYKKKSIEEERLLAKANISKRKKKEERKEEVVEENLSKEIEIYDGMNVKDVADKLRVKETDIIRELFMKGIMVTVNQSINRDTVEKIVLSHGFTIKEEVSKEDEILEHKLEEMSQDESLLQTRPPVVTIMGHVDHGKTSLLDAIRKSKVTEGEAGGITQHIGAYQVHVHDRLITFLDTPGHEAFTAMRARGAKSTDIAVLVVAADDGIMPQTIEAINHAKAASVPIIVAINKMDKPDANPDRVKQQLAEHELVPEDWGGSTVTVPVSARSKMGLDELLEMIILTADLQDIKANPNKPAQGVIIESKLDKGKGAVATVLIQAGTLKVGDNFVVGTVYGKVRAMFDYLGNQVKEATLSVPVQVIGYSAVPIAGEIFKVVGTDKEAREIAEKALEAEKEKSLSPVRSINLESISEQIGEGKIKELNLVVKADVQGSYEALAQSLMKINVEDVKLRLIHSAVGDVTENDVTLAAASSGIIIAFNVKVEPKAIALAEKEQVDIRSYNIIYRVIEDVQKALEGLLEPEMEEVLTGKAEVRVIFTIGKTSVVAGCYVTEGKINRNATIKLMRGNELIHTGKVNALKRFKDDVKEVLTGFECGMSLEKFNDIQEKDVMEAYVMQAKPRN
jgi:translation initiation factor IF-2